MRKGFTDIVKRHEKAGILVLVQIDHLSGELIGEILEKMTAALFVVLFNITLFNVTIKRFIYYIKMLELYPLPLTIHRDHPSRQ